LEQLTTKITHFNEEDNHEDVGDENKIEEKGYFEIYLSKYYLLFFRRFDENCLYNNWPFTVNGQV